MAEKFAEQEREVVDKKNSVTLEHIVPHTDGEHTHLCTKFPVTDSSGRITSVGTISTDITDLKKAEEGRRMALVQAEEANQAKSEFLATISHEFRTPLNAILGFTDILSSELFGPLGDKKYLEYANDIHASGRHLLELINDLLDISAIEAGKLPFDREPLPIKEIISECSRIVKERASASGILFEMDIPDGLSPIFGNRRALKQIFLNLLSNAIKFTGRGEKVTISVEAKNVHTVITVADTGIGIAAEKLPSLTDPFFQGEKSPFISNEGTGLGLAIAKSLVDLHQGTLEITSVPKKGTTVAVTLPNAAA